MAGAGGFDPDVLARHGFPTISYDTLVVGEEFRSDERLLRPQDLEAYAFAVDDHDPWFFGEGPFGGPIAHPTILANQALFLRHNRYVVPVGLHARMVFHFVAPIRLGVRARTVGRVADLYERRDKPYMVTEFTTVDTATDAVLVHGFFVQMLFRAETAPLPGTAPRPELAVASVDPSIGSGIGRHGRIEVSQVLGPVVRTLHQQQLDIYSGVRPGSIHTDVEWARAKGFPTTIAQGMMSTAYVSALLTDAIGQGFVVGGRMDVRFLRPVLCGDTLTAMGTVVGFRGEEEGERRGGVWATVGVEVRNQHGDQTLAGTAGGWLTAES